MASQWTTVTFGEVVRLEQGLCFNKKTNHLMAEAGIPLLRIADLINNTQTKFVDGERVPKKFIANPQDIIYSRTGQVGLVFKGRVGVVHNNCFRVIPKVGIERDYVYWYLRQPSVIQQARTLAGGAAQPDLGHDVFKSISFTYPEPETQRRIVGILSAYDELMENSQRRIQLLEAMARAIYREWFVHFRFPGHEELRRVALSFGDIPTGWEVRKVSEFSSFVRGIEPGSDAYTNEPAPDRIKFLRVGDLSKRESDTFILTGLAEGKTLEPLDIAITLDGAIGLVRLGLSGAYSTGIRKVIVHDETRLGWSFAFHLLLSDSIQATIHAHANGATIKHAGSAVAALEFVSPPPNLIRRFEHATAPMLKQILTLQTQIENLRRTRDLLLPRLLSGQVALASAEQTAQNAES